jgi:WD40 repeat protein
MKIDGPYGSRSAEFSPKGEYILCGFLVSGGDQNDHLRIYDAATGKEIKSFEGHTEDVYDIAFSPDGTTMASGSFDGTVKIWNIAAGQCVAKILPKNRQWIAYTPDCYWDGSSECGDLVSIVQGMSVYNIDQFAL